MASALRRRAFALLITLSLAALGPRSAGAEPPPTPPVDTAPRPAPRAPSAQSPPPRADAPNTPPPPVAPAREERLPDKCRRLATDRLALRGAKAPRTEQQAREQEAFDAMHVACFDAARARLTAGPGAVVGAEILRSVAQVVASRASRAGFALLGKKLREAAGCGKAAGSGKISFANVCRTLSSVSIKDLTASPVVLLDAAIGDLLAAARDHASGPWMRAPILDQALREAAARWGEGGVAGVTSGLHQTFRRQVRRAVEKPSCGALPSVADKALWTAGMCLVEAQSVQSFDTCDAEGWADQCGDPAAVDRILQIWSIANRVHRDLDKDRPALGGLVDLTFAVADTTLDGRSDLSADQKKEAREGTAALRTLFQGIAAKDWVQTSSGAVRFARLISPAKSPCAEALTSAACAAALEEERRIERLFTLLAAVGNFAETFAASSKDAAGASAAREKILEDLVDRMVNRTDRDGGAVVSLGGALGLLGGARTDFRTGAELAFPVQLGLGVGLQSYGSGNAGVHAMFTAIDLGQYVSTGSGRLEVQSPKVESAITLGLTLGGWFALRETPYYVGLYGGMSPFVKADDRMTFQVGVVTGLYVPLLDFN